MLFLAELRIASGEPTSASPLERRVLATPLNG